MVSLYNLFDNDSTTIIDKKTLFGVHAQVYRYIKPSRALYARPSQNHNDLFNARMYVARKQLFEFWALLGTQYCSRCRAWGKRIWEKIASSHLDGIRDSHVQFILVGQRRWSDKARSRCRAICIIASSAMGRVQISRPSLIRKRGKKFIDKSKLEDVVKRCSDTHMTRAQH